MVTQRRNLIIATFGISCVAFTLCIISISTNNWLSASAMLTTRLTSDVNYGLFMGNLARHQLAATLQFELVVSCDFSQSACVYSCQRSSALRENELQRLLAGLPLEPCDQVPNKRRSGARQSLNQTNSGASDTNLFMPAELWLSITFFLVLAAVFMLSAVSFTLLNLYMHPIQPVFNIFGLYIWHVGAACCTLLTIALWSLLFVTHLRKNIAITDTLRHDLTFSSEGRATIGFSFYMLLAAGLLNVLNIALLLLRRHLMSGADAPTTITMEQSDVPLEFY